MGCSVKELSERVSAEELTEWMAYSYIEPFGHTIDHYYLAQIATINANANRSSKQKAFSVDDFVLKYKIGTEKQTVQDHKAILKALHNKLQQK